MHSLVIDTEFTEFQDDAKVISIALLNPETYDYCYVELTEGWVVDECSDFVQEHVLPHLDPVENGATLEGARKAILEFLGRYDSVRLMSDAPGWDYQMLKQVLGSAWPAHVQGLGGMLNLSEIVLDQGWEWQHNALRDAIELVNGYNRLMSKAA